MRILRFSFLVLLAGCTLLVTARSGQAQETRTIERRVDLHHEGHLQIKAFTGGIDVSTWDRPEVEVQARIEGEDVDRVENVEIRIEGGEKSRSIEADYDAVEGGWSLLGLLNFGGDGDKPPVHFTIQMPRTARLSIEDFSSTIEVRDLEGDLSVEAFSSSIHLDGVSGQTDIESFSGSIRAEDLEGGFQVETFSGNVTVRMQSLTDDLQFSSFSGNVDLYLPSDASFEIDAEEGVVEELSSEFVLRTEEDGRRLVGDGGPRIRMEAFSGALSVRTL